MKSGRTAHGFFTKTTRQHNNSLSVKRFLTKHKMTLYSSVLASFEFFKIPKFKSVLKGTRFKSVDEVKAKATELMNKISEDNLQHCFQLWKIRKESCRDRGEVNVCFV
jgi:hypothetical protein